MFVQKNTLTARVKLVNRHNLIKELPMNQQHSQSKRFDLLAWIITIMFGATFTLTPVVIHFYHIESFLRIIIAFVPMMMFVLFLLRFNHTVKSLDELGRRIHVETLVTAFVIMALFSVLGPCLSLAFQWKEAGEILQSIILLPIYYSIAAVIVRRRYL